ncbi:MAG: nucleotidyltransferase domain-containing protein [Methanoregula sp.]|nr:nucleotidyltransferase domain-containing protein [Methanoregula sp.]
MGEPIDKSAIICKMRDVLSGLPSLRVAYVFGSFLSRDDFRDIDIALLAEDYQDKESFLKYTAEAGDRLEEALGFRLECDIKILNDLPVWLKFEIIRTGLPVYVKDENDRIEFETNVTVEYQDLKSMYDLFDREYLARA